jgi:hypothetical protein
VLPDGIEVVNILSRRSSPGPRSADSRLVTRGILPRVCLVGLADGTTYPALGPKGNNPSLHARDLRVEVLVAELNRVLATSRSAG